MCKNIFLFTALFSCITASQLSDNTEMPFEDWLVVKVFVTGRLFWLYEREENRILTNCAVMEYYQTDPK